MLEPGAATNEYNKLVETEREERKKMNEKRKVVKRKRGALKFNEKELKELEYLFKIQKRRTKSKIDTIEHLDDENIEGHIEPEKVNSKKEEFESSLSSLTWSKKSFKVHNVKEVDLSAQQMALVSCQDENVKPIGGDEVHQTKTLEINVHHPLIKDLFLSY